jgi:hypothetical protein
MQKRGLLTWTGLLLIALAAALFPSIQEAEPPQTIRTTGVSNRRSILIDFG